MTQMLKALTFTTHRYCVITNLFHCSMPQTYLYATFLKTLLNYTTQSLWFKNFVILLSIAVINCGCPTE